MGTNGVFKTLLVGSCQPVRHCYHFYH